MLKYLSDGSVTAELKEETVEINGQDAYQISGSLSGDFLKELTASAFTRG